MRAAPATCESATACWIANVQRCSTNGCAGRITVHTELLVHAEQPNARNASHGEFLMRAGAITLRARFTGRVTRECARDSCAATHPPATANRAHRTAGAFLPCRAPH